MSDDNKTNEELLEEVKKLRKLEEKRQAQKEREDDMKVLVPIGCVTIPVIFGLIIWFAT